MQIEERPVDICMSFRDIKELKNKKFKFSNVIEYRIDREISKGTRVDSILENIKYIKKNYKKKLLVTLRTYKDGGEAIIDYKKYLEIIKQIVKFSNFDYIDIEYNKYIKDKKAFDEVTFNIKNKIILSYHNFEERFKMGEYRNLFSSMVKTKFYTIKVSTYAFDKNDLFNLMIVSREFSEKNKNKKFITISMGKIGILSRVWHEYSKSSMTFVSTEKIKVNKLGQLNIDEYKKMRKLCGV